MKQLTILAVSVLAACFLFGCSSGERDFETRRDFAIRQNREQLASTKNEVRNKWSEDILSVLARTDFRTASYPTTASAILGTGTNGTFGLFVFWIENRPSVDGVELQFGDQSTPVVIPIPDQELKNIQRAAKDTIVFGTEYEWRDTDELMKNLRQITRTKDLKIRLLRAKVPVTEWSPVDFYKDGRWIE